MPTSKTGPRSRTPLILLAAALLIGAVLLIGAYIALPLLVENLIARDLQNGLGLAEKPEVNLDGNPLGVLAGKFQGGHVTLTNPDLGVVRPDKVTVNLDPFDLDVLGSLSNGRVESDGPLSGDLTADLSEEEVTRLATSTGVARGVKLEEGRMAVDLAAGSFGDGAPVGVEGNLTVQDGTLHFEPDRAQVLGMPVPQSLLQGAGFSYPISQSLFGVTLSNVEVHKDRLVLSGRVDDLPIE